MVDYDEAWVESHQEQGCQLLCLAMRPENRENTSGCEMFWCRKSWGGAQKHNGRHPPTTCRQLCLPRPAYRVALHTAASSTNSDKMTVRR